MLLISIGCILSLILILKFNNIKINEFIEQYIYLSLDLGSNRFSILNFVFLKENLFKIYFLFFLIIPLLINYFWLFKKFGKNIDKKINLNFIISLFLIIICYIYELHTNNSAMSLLFYQLLFFNLPITIELNFNFKLYI